MKIQSISKLERKCINYFHRIYHFDLAYSVLSRAIFIVLYVNGFLKLFTGTISPLLGKKTFDSLDISPLYKL